MEPDFLSLLSSVPGAYLVVDPRLKIVAATDDYLEASSSPREEIVGHHVLDLPPAPDDRDSQRHSFHRVLQNFVRYVPAAVAMLDREMRYLQASGRFCEDYGLSMEGLVGRSHYEVFPEIPERWKQVHRRALAGETVRCAEDLWERGEKSPMWLRWEIRPWGDVDGRPEGILVFSDDITIYKSLEASLREGEATIRSLLETAAQAIIAVDASGSVVLANRMSEEMFGYAHQELIGKTLESLMPEQFRVLHVSHRADFARNPRTRNMGVGIDLSAVRSDGTEFPVEVSLSHVPTNRGPLSVAFITDITTRKKAELDLQKSEGELRALARSLLSAQEDERRRLARELHDDVTQRLALLSIGIGKLAGDLPATPVETSGRLRALQKQLLEVANEVRRLSHGLHPSLIEDFGLSTALTEFCQEFASAHGITIRFECSAGDATLDRSSSSCLFRIAQECLQNVARHSQATEVLVRLALDGNQVRLSVKDNGVGIVAGRTSPGLGLLGMQERIKSLNGALYIQSWPGEGTELIAALPRNGDSR